MAEAHVRYHFAIIVSFFLDVKLEEEWHKNILWLNLQARWAFDKHGM
jgi:hypothetical protein